MEEHADEPDFGNAGLPHAAHRFHQAARRLVDASESLGSCLGRLAERLPAPATVRPPLAALVRAAIDCRSTWDDDAARLFAARASVAKELDAFIRSGTAESAHEHVYSLAVDVLSDATELLDDLFPGRSVVEELGASLAAEERQALRRWPARLTRSDPAYRESLEVIAASLPHDHALLRQLLAKEVSARASILARSRDAVQPDQEVQELAEVLLHIAHHLRYGLGIARLWLGDVNTPGSLLGRAAELVGHQAVELQLGDALHFTVLEVIARAESMHLQKETKQKGPGVTEVPFGHHGKMTHEEVASELESVAARLAAAAPKLERRRQPSPTNADGGGLQTESRGAVESKPKRGPTRQELESLLFLALTNDKTRSPSQRQLARELNVDNSRISRLLRSLPPDNRLAIAWRLSRQPTKEVPRGWKRDGRVE